MVGRYLSFVLGFLLVALPGALCLAEHTTELAWMQGKVGAGGLGCCNQLDCVEATVALLERGELESVVMVGETELTVPSHWVHPSEDPHGRGFWCFQPQYDLAAPGLTRMKGYKDLDGVMRAIPPETPTRTNTRCLFYAGLN